MISRALEIIKQDKDFRKIKEIWLFGSIVENKMTIRSDVDVCVIFNKISLTDATKFRIRVLGWFDNKIDIQVFNALPEKIKKSILKSHKVLYKR